MSVSTALIMLQNRKRSSPSSQVCDAPSESSDIPARKRLKLVNGVLSSSSSQVHHSPPGPDLTEGKDSLSDGKTMAIPEDKSLREDLEVTVTVISEVKGLEYINTKSSSISQARDSQRKSFIQKDSPQPADDKSKDTSVSSGQKRKRSHSGAGDSRWSVSIEEEEERLKKRRRTADVESASSILSHYQIGKKLGEGGFGVVYKGRRLADGRQVAIKIAEKERNWESIRIPGFPSRLPLEVGLLLLASKDPKTPEVIELLEWEDLPDQYIMVMERPSPCEDLEEFIQGQGGVVREELARVIMGQAAQAAYMCCKRGVFHRDIKPENFLINPKTLELKLIDFGCGARVKKSAYNEFCGTRSFFPPEFDTDGRYYAKPATVWSLGITLFRMVCGRHPDARDLQDISWGRWFQHGVSKECSQLIRSLLQTDPNRRMTLDDIIFHSWFNIKENSQQT